jgi:hypothetical protein
MSEQYSFDEKPKRKNSDDPTTWQQAWQAIGIMMALMVLVSLGGVLVQNTFMGDKLQRYFEIVTTGNYSGNPAAGLTNMYESPVTAVAVTLVSLLISLLALFIVYGLSHFFAIRLNGAGTMRGLIVRANNWMLICYSLFAVVSYIANYVVVSNIVDYAARIDINSSSEALYTFNNYMLSQLQILSASSIGGWLIWSIGMSYVMGKYYQFGQGKGCLAVFFLNLSIFAAYCAISMVVGFALISATR